MMGEDSILTLQSEWLNGVTELLTSVVPMNSAFNQNVTDPAQIRMIEIKAKMLELKYSFDFKSMMTEVKKQYF